MAITSISDLLNRNIVWSNYADISGNATTVQSAIQELLSAKDTTMAEAAYWKLENRVVVQGTVFSAAVPTVRVLIASLMDDRILPVKISILDLLYQILSGATSELEPNRDLVQECKLVAREGLLLIVREFVSGPRRAARDVLSLLETDLDLESLAK